MASYPDFRSILHGEADVVLAVDRHEFHHAVPEVGLVFRDGFFAFREDFEVMLIVMNHTKKKSWITSKEERALLEYLKSSRYQNTMTKYIFY